MEFRQLQYFVAVAEEESFSRAAEKMNVSQPSLSKAIQSIEDEYGVTLVKRTTRSFKLTDAGELIFKQGKSSLTITSSLRTSSASCRATICVRSGSAYLRC